MMRILSITLTLQIALLAHSHGQAIEGNPNLIAFEQALELFQKGQYESAQHYMDAYARLDGSGLEAIEAQYYAALCASRLNRIDSEARLNQFIQAYPNHHKTAQAYYELGNLYAAKQNYTQSLVYYLTVDTTQLDLATQHALQYRLAYAYLNEKNFDQALAYFNEIKKQDTPYTYAANYYAGYIALKSGDYEAALVDLKKAGEDQAYQPVVPYLIVEVFYHQKKFKELVTYSATLGDLSYPLKNQEDIALFTAEAYFFLKEYPAAARHYESYLGLQEGTVDQEVIYRLAYSLYKSTEDYKALKYFKEVALQEGLLGQLASYYLGVLYLKTDQRKLALTAFDQARQKDFDKTVQAEAAFQYAKVNYELGNLTVAIAVLEKFQQIYPKSKHIKEANILLSEAYLHTNNYALAIDYIEHLPSQSVAIRKVYQQVTLYKGQEYFNEEAYDQAEHWLKKSLGHPYDQMLVGQAHLWLGETLAAKQAYKQAIGHYQAILSKQDAYRELSQQALYGLAYAYFNTQDYGQALPKFVQYTKQADGQKTPTWIADARLRTADCYYAIKDYKQALQMYDLVLDQYPAHAHYQKALIYGIQGDTKAAQENLVIIHQQYQHTAYYEKALFEYAYLAFKTQDYPLAIERFTKFIQQRPHSSLLPDALLDRAIACGNLEQHRQAAEDYKLILQDYPKHAHATSALLELPKLLIQLGEPEKVQQYLASYEAANPSSNSLEYLNFETAKSLFYNQSYTQAATQLDSFIRNYPSSGLMQEAYFLLAEAHYRMGDYAQALSNYQAVLKASGSVFHNKALLRLASIAYEQQDYATALDYYKELQLSASNKKENYYALEGIMKASYGLQQYDQSKQAASLIKEQGNITINATDQAVLYLAKSAMQQGEKQKAMDYFKQLLATGKDSYAAEAQYRIAQILYETGEYNQSLETLFELNKQFSTYTTWVNQAFLLIADNYMALGELFQAKATLQSIIENATDTAIIGDARQKLLEVTQQADSLAQPAAEKEPVAEREEDSEFKTLEP
jgi:TolA-binding protein